MTTARITCLPEARENFRLFHNESVQHRRGEYQDIEAEPGRWRENAIRIGVTLAVAASGHRRFPENVFLLAPLERRLLIGIRHAIALRPAPPRPVCRTETGKIGGG